MGAVRNQLKKEGLSKKTIDVIADALEAQGEFTSLGWVDVASATITNIAAANSPNVRITGTNTITGLGTAASGTKITARFAGALTFTHNGTSLILPGTANITTAANDTADMVSLGSGNWICTNYKKASGAAVVAAGSGNTITKSADESVTNSTTLQDDDDFQFAVDANGLYEIEVIIISEHTSNGSPKAQFKVPSLKTSVTEELINGVPSTSGGGSSPIFIPVTTSNTTAYQIGSGNCPQETPDQIYLKGMLRIGGTGGTCKLRWAQLVGDATATKFLAGSYLKYTKLN